MTFTELLDHYSIPYVHAGTHRHATHGRVSLDCPSCSPNSGKFKAGYHLEKRYLNCWSCGFLPLFQTLSTITGEPYGKIKELLGGLERDRTEQSRTRGKLTLPDGVGPMQKPHRDYLRKRGFDPEAIERLWGVQGIGLAKKLAWRLFVPLHLDREIVSWTTRSISPDNPVRYWTAKPEQETVSSKTLLYGSDYANQTIIVCEGPADTWRIGPGAVSTLGVSVSRVQIAKMARYPTRVICFDSDAQERAKRLCDQLSAFPGKTVNVCLETGKDAGECDSKEIQELRRRFLE